VLDHAEAEALHAALPVALSEALCRRISSSPRAATPRRGLVEQAAQHPLRRAEGTT
jgi:hypothetical protein